MKKSKSGEEIMKRILSFLFAVLLLFLSINFAAQYCDPVDIETAKRAAEYYGEMIFEKDLKICDYELMLWPWGEPAVYAFTLMKEGDIYPQNIHLDYALKQGAYLVSIGKELEGYTMMAQQDHYMTVYTGATTDMPSFIKGHIGLPEHVLALAEMDNPPLQPLWIYGGLFDIYLISKIDFDRGVKKVQDIHFWKSVDLSEFPHIKQDAVPDYAEIYEWEPFHKPGDIQINNKSPFIKDAAWPKIKEGEHKLDVEEINIKGGWQGCSPAAFTNCLWYLEKKRHKINLKGKNSSYLQLWTAVNYRTTPYTGKGTGASKHSWIIEGSKRMFKGLGYNSQVTAYQRRLNQPGAFLNKFAKEINAKYPCNLGSAGTGIFRQHSTTGIGYVARKNIGRYQLIIHDGWKKTPNVPVYINYHGYPEDIQYPKWIRTFRPLGRHDYKEAKPELVNEKKIVELNMRKKMWRWKDKIKSENEVNVEFWAYAYVFRDIKNKKYEPKEETIQKRKRIYPYKKKGTWKRSLSFIKRGSIKRKFYLIDENGHLILNFVKTLRLEHIIGKWQLNFTWDTGGSGSTYLYLYSSGSFKTDDGARGDWTLRNGRVKLDISTGQKPIYTGTCGDKYETGDGAMKCRVKANDGKKHYGTWTMTRISTWDNEQESESPEQTPGNSLFEVLQFSSHFVRK